MATNSLRAVRACVFDAYGTLFDFASAARHCRDVLGDSFDKLTALWRDKQLQYTWLRAAQGRHADFWQVTGDALDFSLETLMLDQPWLRDRLMELYLTLDTFPEVPDVLRQLKAAGLKTAILSNGTPAMLDSAVKNARIDGLLDIVLSVEEVGVYKPDPRVYQLAVDQLGIPASQISFQSSNAWDAYAASAFGMKVVWCNRYRQRKERLPGKPDYEIETLCRITEKRRCGSRDVNALGKHMLTLRFACRCALSDGVPRRSFFVALVVGTVLNLINQGDALFGAAPINWLKIILTYFVPYAVCTYGAVSFQLRKMRP